MQCLVLSKCIIRSIFYLFRCIHFAPPKYYTTYFTTTFRGLFYLGFHFEGNVSIKATSKINSAIDVVRKIMKAELRLVRRLHIQISTRHKITFVFCSNVERFSFEHVRKQRSSRYYLTICANDHRFSSEPACRLIEHGHEFD